MSRIVKANRQINKNLLIICEGEDTEPSYFEQLRFRVNQTIDDYYVEIRPKPKDIEEQELIVVKIRPGGKSRKVKEIAVEPDMVEEQYVAQPTRYVREAQLGLLDNLYTEAWAVFDQDGHAAHPSAYELAQVPIEGKLINVAYSGISFEIWVLLHFEFSQKIFLRSQCRTGKRSHHCGDHVHSQDCKGEQCVAGYLKSKGYVAAGSNAKHVEYAILEEKVDTAIENAIQLRLISEQAKPGARYYEYNPYTSIDKLVFKLLALPTDYNWYKFEEEFQAQEMTWQLNIKQKDIAIIVTNISQTKKIIHPEDVVLVDVERNTLQIMEKSIPEVGDVVSVTFDWSKVGNFKARFVAVRIKNNAFYIAELPPEVILTYY